VVLQRVLAGNPDKVVAVTALHFMGSAYMRKEDGERAAAESLKKAIALAPTSARTWKLLGVEHLTSRIKNVEGALVAFRKSIDLDPGDDEARLGLARTWQVAGKLKNAIKAYREAVAINDKNAEAWSELGLTLVMDHQEKEGIAALRKAIAIDESYVPGLVNLGATLLETGEDKEALEILHRAQKLMPTDPLVLHSLGRAMALRQSWDEAIDFFSQAIRGSPELAAAYAFRGEARRMKGQYAAALDDLRKGRKLAADIPELVSFAEGLIRDTERLQKLEPRLAPVLRGDARPADAAEAIALAKLCQEQKHWYLASARLFTDAFAREPLLADDLTTDDRYNAACVAALAGCGQGEDAAGLDPKERARWRKQALDWLQADLAARTKRVERGNADDKFEVRMQMGHWQKDTDLAGVRDAAALDKLPAEECEAWRKLWADVERLRQKTSQPR
jgi:tetratricopeptide (TPR) repeat protein